MKRLALLLAALLTAALLPASGHPVIPAPASFTGQPGEYRLTSGATFSLTGAAREGELAQYIASLPFALKEAPRGGALTLRIDPRRVAAEEGYTLEVTPRRINVEARSEAGAFYALQTGIALVDLEDHGAGALKNGAPGIVRNAQAAVAVLIRPGNGHKRHIAANVAIPV